MTPLILTVHFFRTPAGTEPVRDFLCNLPTADRKVLGTDIKTVQFGWPLGMPVVRKRIDNAKIDTVLSNSFGFGGTNATLVFQRHQG